MAYKVFVSSTFEDLKVHRAYVINAVRKAGLFVDPMEDWTASTDEPKIFSQQRVNGCDLCILLVAFRRGHISKNEKLSITQLEFLEAAKAKIDTLVFLLDTQAPWQRHFDELSQDEELVTWRSELMESKGVNFFGLDPESIEIAPAISRWLSNKKTDLEFKNAHKISSPSNTYDPEDELWIIVRNSEQIDDFRKFIEYFPNGRLAKMAEIRLNQLLSVRSERNKKISFFINSCRELSLIKPYCDQCGNKVYIDLPVQLQKLLDELELPPRNKQYLHLNGGIECANYKRKNSLPVILPELTDKECEHFISEFCR